MQTLDYIVIAFYFIGLVAIILMIKRANTIEDFAVGSREIPSSIVFASLAANAIGPGYSMGLTNKAAANGYIWFFIFLAFSAQTLLIAYFVAPRLRQFAKAYTIGDIMGYRYGKLVKYITSALCILLCAGFIGAIANASGNIINTIFGIPFIGGIIITTIAVIAYTTYGGIKVDIITDVIHLAIMAIAIPAILVFMSVEKGLPQLLAQIPTKIDTASGGLTTVEIAGLVLSFFLGETLIPSYTNRALAAKDEAHAKNGFLKVGFFTIAWFFVCTSIGVLSASQFPDSQNVYLTAIKTYLPVGVYGLVVAVLVNIVMKSQDSLLNAASVALNNDFLNNYSADKSDTGDPLLVTRMFNVFIGVVAVLFAVNVPSVIDALLICYTLWAPTVVLPLIIGVLKKDVKPLSGLLAILGGGIGTAIWEWGLHNPNHIPSLLVGILCNQVLFWASELIFTKPSNSAYLQPLPE
jgi:solute:Na+ symporter, SSS family